jgi:hypothetical protein
VYRNKPPVQIEREIQEKRDELQKELNNPKVNPDKVNTILFSIKTLKANLSHAQNMYVEKIIKEAGNEFLSFLLSNTLQHEDACSWNYKDVEKFRLSSPNEWKLWWAAMQDEFKSLQDRN